jgi:hypothetical protein
VALYIVSTGVSPVAAADANQYFNLLTGATTDQQVTVANRIRAQFTGATGGSGGYVGATTSGAPVSGTFVVGDWVVTTDGVVWVCMVAGTPGTWQALPGTYISENLKTSGDVVQNAGDNTVLHSLTFTAVSGQRYAAYWHATYNYSTGSSSITTLRHASGSSITTSSTAVLNRASNLIVTGKDTPTTVAGTFVATASGNYTFGITNSFFSGSTTLTWGANSNNGMYLQVRTI